MQLDAHPHAAAIFAAALAQGPNHAYLLAGPAGSGKRDAARRFAAELLADGNANAHERVLHGTHPDLTWVTPSGAHEMLRSDVDEAVVGAAAHTPFESRRRVFVIERADVMNDQAANTLLKTLEEPPAYVVLLLLSDRPGQVLPTIASRCQYVRFDPLPAEQVAARLAAAGIDERTALACARLSLGDAERAGWLATKAGTALRDAAEAYASEPAAKRPWRAILEAGSARAAVAVAALETQRDEEQEFLPRKEHKRHQSAYGDRIKRTERNERTRAIDHALQLTGLWLRDQACVAAGAPELVHNVDRDVPAPAAPAKVREAIALVDDTRARLALNVSEDLALEALAFRLERLR